MKTEKICIHAYVSGRVQGVFFRHSTRKKALELGLSGWVRNLPDGRVEVFACGDKSTIENLQEWLWQGPPNAAVSDVTSENKTYSDLNSFDIK